MLVNLNNKSKFYCDFDLHLITITSKDDLKIICKKLKKNNIIFSVVKNYGEIYMDFPYDIKIYNYWISSYDDNKIRFY